MSRARGSPAEGTAIDVNPIAGLVKWYTGRWRYPRLLLFSALVFGADLIFPDAVPFADEILLGVGTVLLGSMKRRRSNPSKNRPEMPD